MKKKISDQEVTDSAKAMAFYKGDTYSFSEFVCYKTWARQELIDKGATKKQLELFEKTVAALPLRNGHFNPYSGD